MAKIKSGDFIQPILIESVNLGSLSIPAEGKITHLQFRRFSGCPICNLHLQSFNSGYSQLRAANIQEVVVFHSTKDVILSSRPQIAFALIADPQKKLYQQFGVEESWLSILHPASWWSGIKGLLLKETNPFESQGHLGLPADFLIDERGQIIASKYGEHADDQWSLNEVLQLAVMDSAEIRG